MTIFNFIADTLIGYWWYFSIGIIIFFFLVEKWAIGFANNGITGIFNFDHEYHYLRKPERVHYVILFLIALPIFSIIWLPVVALLIFIWFMENV